MRWNERTNVVLATVGAVAVAVGMVVLASGAGGDQVRTVPVPVLPVEAVVSVPSSTALVTVPVPTVSVLTGSPAPGYEEAAGASGHGPTPVASPILTPTPTTAAQAISEALPPVAVDSVSDLAPVDVGPDETGYVVTDDSTQAAGGPESAIARVDPASNLPFVEGPGGFLLTDVLPDGLADAYGVPRGTLTSDVNFGQVGGDLVPFQFHTPGSSDLRVISCPQPGATGPQMFPASSVPNVDALLAGGCTVVGS